MKRCEWLSCRFAAGASLFCSVLRWAIAPSSGHAVVTITHCRSCICFYRRRCSPFSSSLRASDSRSFAGKYRRGCSAASSFAPQRLSKTRFKSKPPSLSPYGDIGMMSDMYQQKRFRRKRFARSTWRFWLVVLCPQIQRLLELVHAADKSFEAVPAPN